MKIKESPSIILAFHGMLGRKKQTSLLLLLLTLVFSFLTAAVIYSVFDRVTAYTFQNQFLGSMRTAVWNCLLQKSLQPTVDWAKDFWQMSLLRKATFLYGGVRLGQTVANYWKM